MNIRISPKVQGFLLWMLSYVLSYSYTPYYGSTFFPETWSELCLDIGAISMNFAGLIMFITKWSPAPEIKEENG